MIKSITILKAALKMSIPYKKTFFAVFATFLCDLANPGSSNAAEVEYSSEYNNCMKSTDVRLEMLDCMNSEFDALDIKLNKVYGKVLARSDEFKAEKIKTAQRIWIDFRDAHCEVWGTMNKGSIRSIDFKSCVMDVTYHRILDLEEYIQ